MDVLVPQPSHGTPHGGGTHHVTAGITPQDPRDPRDSFDCHNHEPEVTPEAAPEPAPAPAPEPGLASIPPHPLGVKPLGNQYLLDTTPNARGHLGALQAVPDEMLMLILEWLDASALLQLGAACRFLFAFCHLDELWRAVFLRDVEPTPPPPPWRGSWRRTVLRIDDDSQIPPPDCSTVFSDLLHRPYACSQINLGPYADHIPRPNQIARFGDLDPRDFAAEWAGRPFILTDPVRAWPAYREWTLDSLRARYGPVKFRAEAVDWTLDMYCAYMAAHTDESPLYLFDREFVTKMAIEVGVGAGVAGPAGAAYWRPDAFGPDLFEALGRDRPAHRWLIVGPAGSGSTFHKDPNGTSAWNAVVAGSKYWIMFPPAAAVPGVYVSADGAEVTSPLSVAEWLLAFHAEARRRPGCVEAVCRPGEVLHVPSGWWHLVVNLEAGIAITQNFVPRTASLGHLGRVLAFLRDRPGQVTGFGPEVADPYGLFVDRLRQEHPGLVESALEGLDGAKGQKRKWAEAVGRVPETEPETETEQRQPANGGFSFGFASDDDDDGEVS